MAALRFSRPGYPTELRDIGPSQGRVTGQNYGGAMAVAGGPVSPRILPATTPARQAQMAAYKASRRTIEVCGREFVGRYHGTCARSSGHGGGHQSRASMDRKARAVSKEHPTCGAFMAASKERCARRPGHAFEHRTAYAMENARRKGAA